MGRNYYCLVAGLPDIQFDEGKLSYQTQRFREEIYDYLSSDDKRLIDLLHYRTDNRNVLVLLKNGEAQLEAGGMLSAEQLGGLIKAVKDGDKCSDRDVPPYLYTFVAQYLAGAGENVQLVEDMLWGYYYEYAMKCKNRFVSAWFEFNLNLNNLVTAFTARKLKWNVSSLLVGDTEVCRQIRTSNARDFGLQDTLDYVEAVQHLMTIDNLAEREKQMDLLKWRWLDDNSTSSYFGVEQIFAFYVKLCLVERWASLDKDSGNALFRKLIDGLKHDVQIPALG